MWLPWTLNGSGDSRKDDNMQAWACSFPLCRLANGLGRLSAAPAIVRNDPDIHFFAGGRVEAWFERFHNAGLGLFCVDKTVDLDAFGVR